MNKQLEEAIKVLKEWNRCEELVIKENTDYDKTVYVERKHAIEIVLNYIENSIPKQVVEEALKYIEDYFERLNGPDEDIEYIKDIKQELLEGK